MDLIGNGFEQGLEEFPGSLSISRFNKLSDSKLGSSVDADEEKKLSFSGLHLGNVPSRGLHANHCRAADVENPPLGDASIACRPMDGVALEFLPLGLVALDIRQT